MNEKAIQQAEEDLKKQSTPNGSNNIGFFKQKTIFPAKIIKQVSDSEKEEKDFKLDLQEQFNLNEGSDTKL